MLQEFSRGRQGPYRLLSASCRSGKPQSKSDNPRSCSDLNARLRRVRGSVRHLAQLARPGARTNHVV